jgi:superfamily II DNA or RNA helicase
MAWCIYKHTNKINGKVYIGQTCQAPEDRWQNGYGYRSCPKMWAAIEKYGWHSFLHEIISDNIVTQEEANYLERYWIHQYNSIDEGYNILPGGAHKCFDYNQRVYNEAELYLHNDNKVLIVLGTCIGKTTTALEFLYNHNCRGLVLGPTENIYADWGSKYADLVDAMSYSAFANQYDTIDYSKYGCVICDEVHHCVGEKTYGKGIKYLIDNKIIKVIGLTATQMRTDGIDVGDNLFGGNVCRGLTVLEGIKQGYVHPFSYITAIFDTDDMIEEVIAGREVERTLLGRLDLAKNNTVTVTDILVRHMEGKKRKGIIFVSKIEELSDAISFIHKAFPNDICDSLHSYMSEDSKRTVREWFEATDEGWLVNVNMVSEGSHFHGITALVCLRRTKSQLLFQQQLGRVITLTKYPDPEAVVFDLVNNAHSLGEGKAFSDQLLEASKSAKSKQREGRVSNQIIVKDYTEDLVQILEEIKNSFIHKAIWWLDYEGGLRFASAQSAAEKFKLLGVELSAEGIGNAARNNKPYCGLTFSYSPTTEKNNHTKNKVVVVGISPTGEIHNFTTWKKMTQASGVSKERAQKQISGYYEDADGWKFQLPEI